MKSESKWASTPEQITGWVLGGVSVSLTLVIAWWWWRDPEVFFSQRLGITDGIWSMPWVWSFALAIAVVYIALTATMPVVKENFFRFNWLKILGIWAAIVTGIVEEVVFRQMLMDWLDSIDIGVVWQVLVSGLVFGVAHAVWALLQGAWRAAVPAVVATFALGVALALLYLAADRSTLPAIASHMLINLWIEPWLILAFVTGGRWDRRQPVES